MLEQIKLIEVYSCVGSMVLGYYVVVFIRVIPGGITGWEEINPVGMAPGGAPVAYLGNYNDVRDRI